jgi:hypothetical protein
MFKEIGYRIIHNLMKQKTTSMYLIAYSFREINKKDIKICIKFSIEKNLFNYMISISNNYILSCTQLIVNNGLQIVNLKSINRK